MAGVDQVALDQAFERLVGLTRTFGSSIADGWALEPGRQGPPRTPWRIVRGRQVVVTVGYTRRQALDSLQSMCSILAVILGA